MEKQWVRGDDDGDVSAGEAGAGEQGEDSIRIGGGVETGVGELIQ
jgi:hypothetical protein